MAPATNTSKLFAATNSWALPIAATILVAGSLVFWSCIGLIWLATRQSAQQPIVIWMPPATNTSAADETNSAQIQSANVPRDR